MALQSDTAAEFVYIEDRTLDQVVPDLGHEGLIRSSSKTARPGDRAQKVQGDSIAGRVADLQDSDGGNGGSVFSKWCGLKEELLEGPGDLPVVFNYRDVLAPVLQRHGAGADFSKIFPNYPVSPLLLFS